MSVISTHHRLIALGRTDLVLHALFMSKQIKIKCKDLSKSIKQSLDTSFWSTSEVSNFFSPIWIAAFDTIPMNRKRLFLLAPIPPTRLWHENISRSKGLGKYLLTFGNYKSILIICRELLSSYRARTLEGILIIFDSILWRQRLTFQYYIYIRRYRF